MIANFLDRYKDSFSLFILLVISLASMFINSYLRRGGEIKNLFSEVVDVIVYPFNKLYNSMYSGVNRVWEGITEYRNLQMELEEAKRKLERYERERRYFETLKKENEHLLRLLNIKSKYFEGYETEIARVVGRDPDNWYNALILDKGSKNGIKVDMPVIGYYGVQQGVVGKIVEVRHFFSRVLPIISSNFGIAVRVRGSKLAGVMVGLYPKSRLCEIKYVYSPDVVSIGSEVITSGEFSIFPKGLPVGKIVKVERIKTLRLQKIIVKPYIDIGAIDEVFIIKKVKPKEVEELLNEVEDSK